MARSSRPCLNQNPSYRDKIGHPDKLSTALEGPFLQAQRHPHFINAIMQATATDTRPGAKEDVEKFHKIHHGYQTLQQEVMQAAQQSVTPEVLNNATQSPNPSTISAVVQTQPFFAKTVNQPLGQPKQVVLEKQPKKYLGMSMESTPNGLYITEVQEGKLANRSGGLVAGMVILEINARRADSWQTACMYTSELLAPNFPNQVRVTRHPCLGTSTHC